MDLNIFSHNDNQEFEVREDLKREDLPKDLRNAYTQYNYKQRKKGLREVSVYEYIKHIQEKERKVIEKAKNMPVKKAKNLLSKYPREQIDFIYNCCLKGYEVKLIAESEEVPVAVVIAVKTYYERIYK